MPFRLKNAKAIYQRLMNKVFANYIETLMEIYIDNMLVKMEDDGRLISNLETIFSCLCKHKMWLNPQKCAFIVKTGKYLGFMFIHQGIQANPDKCQVIVEMKSLTFVKEDQCLTGRIASLFKFMATSTRKALPFFFVTKRREQFLMDNRV